MSDQGLLTFAVLGYNQERFIRDAVLGAFAQTYSPLQIVLSDDASTDRTFAIMREMAGAYRGSHRIVLNRNTANLGLAGHTNRVASIAHGELILMAAGDDISLPHRADTVWRAWNVTNGKSFGVHSRCIPIDADGMGERHGPAPDVPPDAFSTEDGRACLHTSLRTGQPVILGCTAAWHRDLFERFGPLPDDVVYEDMALGFRARLMGGMAFVDTPLVAYRLHDANIHHASAARAATWQALTREEKRQQTGLRRRMVVAGSFRRDLALARNLISEDAHAGLLVAVNGFDRINALELELRTTRLPRRVGVYLELRRALRAHGADGSKLAYRLLPPGFYRSVRLAKAHMGRHLTPPERTTA